MSTENNQDTTGQTGIDQETERRNRENETGQQSQQPQAGQQQPPEMGQTQQPPQAGQQQQQQPELGQSDTMTKPEDNFAADKQGSEGGSGFVGSSDDKSSDYLTKGEQQDFAPEGQGASDTNAGTSDIETGQSTNLDATLDDGADTSQ
ncbi:MAG: hypothetical protein ABIR87_00985 [Sphingomicrobium sp.]